jgi:hypothetical protein
MPSTSKKQHNFMAAIANNPAFSKKVGIPQSVGKDFTAADKGKKFRTGGRPAAINKQNTQHGKMDMPFNALNRYTGLKTGGKMKDKMGMKMGGMHKMPDGKMMKDSAMKMRGMKEGGMAMVEKDGKMVPDFAADGKGKMKTGGMAGKKKMMGGGMSGYAKGGGIESKGKTKGTVIRMASGGSVSARADGIAQRGKTKFKMC